MSETRRRTDTEKRRCSTTTCPGDGRYQPPGRGHVQGCEHDATKWVWEEVPVDYQPEPPVQPPTLAMVYGYELATNEITDKVRKWVKDYAYAEDDMVVTEEAVRELLDLVDPDWRSVFAG